LSLFALAAVLYAQDPAGAMAAISAQSLKGHVSFLASDSLEGRDTPSKGLDIAAEYIASRFRATGLEPACGDSYFQDSDWVRVAPVTDGFSLTIEGAAPIVLDASSLTALASASAVTIDKASLVRVSGETVASVKPADLEGKVAIAPYTDRRNASRLRAALARLKPQAMIFAASGKPESPLDRAPRLEQAGKADSWVPYVRVASEELFKLVEASEAGPLDRLVSLRLPASTRTPVKLRNVAAVLRGSDPALRDTYVLVTAHYDHIGMKAGAPGDNIFNGANDDASGTAAMLEIAAAFGQMKQAPRRSLLFIAFFGEEKGLLGSKYYAEHPLVPLPATVAGINLEHMGRSDADEGVERGRLSITGMDYSDIGRVFQAVGAQTGVEVYRSDRYNDLLFPNSDNLSLAEKGVVAHTLVAAYMFPDYHKAEDHWDRLDYPNMELVTRTVALGVQRLANSAETPKWDETSKRAARYREAGQKLRDHARSGN